MSRKADCYDDAAMERFFHSLKVKAIHGEYFPTRKEAKQTNFETIEIDYNRLRQHATIGYHSPMDFEKLAT